jgi:hypothetical protein
MSLYDVAIISLYDIAIETNRESPIVRLKWNWIYVTRAKYEVRRGRRFLATRAEHRGRPSANIRLLPWSGYAAFVAAGLLSHAHFSSFPKVGAGGTADAELAVALGQDVVCCVQRSAPSDPNLTAFHQAFGVFSFYSSHDFYPFVRADSLRSPFNFTLEGSILNSHQNAMIAGGIIHAETAPVDSASLLAQSSQPSRHPSTSSPTPEHRATSFGKVIVVLIHVVLTLGLFRRLCARHHSDTLVIRPEQARAIW